MAILPLHHAHNHDGDCRYAGANSLGGVLNLGAAMGIKVQLGV
jgi:hypothetical protein